MLVKYERLAASAGASALPQDASGAAPVRAKRWVPEKRQAVGWAQAVQHGVMTRSSQGPAAAVAVLFPGGVSVIS